ncbi:MAG: ExbD/TolR family protein, partial [Bacteroidota bacterium]
MNLKSRNKVSGTFSMSSMTDMIFILLIFFMIMSTLVDPNKRNALKVHLPQSTKNKMAQPEITRVIITSDLEFYVDDKQVDVESLEQILNEKLSGYEKARISLHADKSIPYENVV